MTCIVGLLDKGTVWMGGDSAGIANWDLTIRSESKVWKREGFIFGSAGSHRVLQLLKYELVIPPLPQQFDNESNFMQYMVTKFVPAVRECLKNGGAAEKNDEVEKGGIFLVGCSGYIYKIQSDYQVLNSRRPWLALGCGSNYAQGVLYATPHLDPQSRVLLALEAAEQMSAGVRGPFTLESVET
jgi:ATP-dependent protease HslVU (ClpYQ) peptidase subunit